MFSYKISIIIFTFLSVYTSMVLSCETDFEGGKFLKALHSKGAEPISTCLEANLNQNKFYAPPGKACKIILPRTGWFFGDWYLKEVQGIGTFRVQPFDHEIIITIKASGGFQLKKIVAGMKDGDCKSASIDALL